ncbi:hypothetical protein F4604DRAFT_1689084 [Suillus subluteus]|nr:hypothetical protein F4604DRAFT_1689084 [Suillus subluteus]
MVGKCVFASPALLLKGLSGGSATQIAWAPCLVEWIHSIRIMDSTEAGIDMEIPLTTGYKLAVEGLQQEWTNDSSANQDIRYEMYFHEEGDEVTSMLAAIQVLDMVHGPRIAATPVPQLPIHEDAGLDEYSSDSRWEDFMEVQPTTSAATLGNQEDPYDFGWESQPDDCVVTNTVASRVTQEDPYDCRWDEPMDPDGVSPVADPYDPYDCGWDDADDGHPDTISGQNAAAGNHLDVVDLTSYSGCKSFNLS